MTTFDHPFLVGVHGTSGLTRDEARSVRLAAPYRGVRTPVDWPTDLAGRTQALAPALTDVSFFCGVSASTFLNFPLPLWLSDARVEVAGPEHSPQLHRQGVVHRRLQVLPEEVIVVNGVRVTSPARTFLDLAARLPFHHLVAVGDEVLRSHGVSREELLVVMNHRMRYTGKPLARRTIPFLIAEAESPQESRARALMHEFGLPKPVPQYLVRDSDGRVVARTDLAYPSLKIAIEYDGDVHRPVEQFRKDAARRTALRALGWYVVELTADDLVKPYRIIEKVAAAIRACT